MSFKFNYRLSRLKHTVSIYVYPNLKITEIWIIWHNRYADGHTITIYQSFIHDYTYTANCLFDSQSPTHRRPVADQSPTSCRSIATHLRSIAHQSPTGRLFLGIVVADQSPIDLQPKGAVFDRTAWLHWLQLLFSRNVVADRLRYMCDRGFTQPFIQGADQRKHQSSASLAFVRGVHRWPVNSPHKGPATLVDAENVSIWWRHHDVRINRLWI